MAGDRRFEEQRPYAVPPSLDQLEGPVAGVVALPVSIAWSGRREYDLGTPAEVAVMYERVIVEAPNAEVLSGLLERGLLLSVWRQLYLPVPVRQLWETPFPQLASAA